MENPEYMAAFITQHILRIMNSAGRPFSLTMDLLGPLILHLFAASLPATWHQICVCGIWPSKTHLFRRIHPRK